MPDEIVSPLVTRSMAALIVVTDSDIGQVQAGIETLQTLSTTISTILTGARWSLAGAEAVLRLRALRVSGDFDEYWHFHEAQEYQRNHLALYADHKVPPTHKPLPRQASKARAHLKIVK